MNTTGKVVTGFLVGTAVGALAGILFAPDKGKEIRAQIADRAKASGEVVAKGLEKARHMVGLGTPDTAKRVAER